MEDNMEDNIDDYLCDNFNYYNITENNIPSQPMPIRYKCFHCERYYKTMSSRSNHINKDHKVIPPVATTPIGTVDIIKPKVGVKRKIDTTEDEDDIVITKQTCSGKSKYDTFINSVKTVYALSKDDSGYEIAKSLIVNNIAVNQSLEEFITYSDIELKDIVIRNTESFEALHLNYNDIEGKTCYPIEGAFINKISESTTEELNGLLRQCVYVTTVVEHALNHGNNKQLGVYGCSRFVNDVLHQMHTDINNVKLPKLNTTAFTVEANDDNNDDTETTSSNKSWFPFGGK